MALVSMRQLLDHAAENGYGLPAFNVNNMEQVHAIMQAADATNSPVIMQGSTILKTMTTANPTMNTCRILLNASRSIPSCSGLAVVSCT